MRSPHNAVSDTMAELHMENSVRETVANDAQNPRKWTIRLESYPNTLIRSFIDIEVIEEDDGDASVCVMRRFNVGRRALNRIMNTLVEKLDDEPRWAGPSGHGQPPGGQPSQQA